MRAIWPFVLGLGLGLSLLERAAALAAPQGAAAATAAATAAAAAQIITEARPLCLGTKGPCSPIASVEGKLKKLVVVLPQLGEFDSSELVEQLVAVDDDLTQNGIDLRVVGIGDLKAAQEFSDSTSIRTEHCTDC